MKVICSSCQAKYNIADEKVAGKVVKIKCKKCAATILINGAGPSDDPDVGAVSVSQRDMAALHTSSELVDEDGATRVFNTSTTGMTAAPGEWTITAPDGGQRSLSTAQIKGELASGALPPDTYVWKEGMADWQPLSTLPEFASDVPNSGGPASSRRSDLFSNTTMSGPPSRPAPASSPARYIGERNESSVLFSLNALQSASQAPPRREGIDLSPTPGMPANRSGLEALLASGGGGGAPSLAPPAAAAPVIAPPPPPAAAQGMAPLGSAQNPLLMAKAEPQRKLPVALIAGGVVLAMCLSGLVVYLLVKPAAPVAEAPKATDANAALTMTPPAATAIAVSPAAVATAVPTAEASASASPAASDSPAQALAAPAQRPAAQQAVKPPPAAPAPPQPPPPPAAGATKPFDRGAASASLGGIAGSARSCKKPGGPTGSGSVRVTFAPSGTVTSTDVGAPFGGTSVGNCIAGLFRRAKVPPFTGSAVSVRKSFTL